MNADLLKRIVISCSLVSGLSSLQVPAQADDLIQTYHDALDNDAVYAAAKASYNAAIQKLPEGRASLLPTLSVTGHSSWSQLSSKTGLFQGGYDSGGYTLQYIQHVFNVPAWEDFKVGQILAQQSETQLVADTQALMVRVAQAYFDLLGAEEVLEAQRSLKDASHEQLDIAKNTFRVGTKPITDVYEAQSRFDLATAAVIAAENDVDVKADALKQMTGRTPEDLPHLKDGVVPTPPQPDDLDTWVKNAESNNPKVITKELAYEVAKHDSVRAHAAHLPTVDLIASRQNVNDVNTLTGAPESTDTKSIMLQLNMPLYTGGRMSAKATEASALREKALEEWNDAKRTLGHAAQQNFLGVVSGIAQVKALMSAVASSLESLKGNKRGYQVGVRANIDVLNALSQVADSHQRLTKARFDTLLAMIKLKAATGQLTEGDLDEVNALLIK